MINKIGIHIKAKDFNKSVKFYKSLGFQKVFEYGPNAEIKEDYNGMVFEANNCRLEIADGHRAVKSEVFKEIVKSSKISLMINVDSLLEILNLCKKNRIKIAVPPRHYYWGTLEIVIKDPDGIVLVFISGYDEKEARKIKADEKWAKKH